MKDGSQNLGPSSHEVEFLNGLAESYLKDLPLFKMEGTLKGTILCEDLERGPDENGWELVKSINAQFFGRMYTLTAKNVSHNLFMKVFPPKAIEFAKASDGAIRELAALENLPIPVLRPVYSYFNNELGAALIYELGVPKDGIYEKVYGVDDRKRMADILHNRNLDPIGSTSIFDIINIRGQNFAVDLFVDSDQDVTAFIENTVSNKQE
jgi:hypothetical protein